MDSILKRLRCNDEPYFKVVNEPSYYVQLHYDALYDYICFYTLYRFSSKELAEEFLSIANSQSNIECNKNIFFEIKKQIPNKENFRPLMTDLQVALKDLQDFKQYCNTYYYDTFRYKYKESIIEEKLTDYELVKLRNENDILKEKLELLQPY